MRSTWQKGYIFCPLFCIHYVMSIPYATRCVMQALRSSSDERAQNVYALIVEALVSGSPEDLQGATEALQRVQTLSLAPAPMPTHCHADLFRPLHDEAIHTATSCGIALPTDVASEYHQRTSRASISYIMVGIALIMICVVIHAALQRCKPAQACAL